MDATHGLRACSTESTGRASEGKTRPRGRPPTDHALVTARVAALVEQNPQISIRALARTAGFGRPAVRAARSRLREAARWVSNPDSAFLAGGEDGS
jgi:hypothetical protein